MRFRCKQDSYTLFCGSRLLQFTGGLLTTNEAGAAAIRAHPMYGRLFVEVPDPLRRRAYSAGVIAGAASLSRMRCAPHMTEWSRPRWSAATWLGTLSP
jgi:hypothetical protein